MGDICIEYLQIGGLVDRVQLNNHQDAHWEYLKERVYQNRPDNFEGLKNNTGGK